MDAVISGQCGFALLLDGDSIRSIHTRDLDTILPRREADIPYLFEDATDLCFFEDIELEDAKRELDLADQKEDALHLALFILDPDFTAEEKQESIEVMEELVTDPAICEYIESVLYATPLPNSENITQARHNSKQFEANSLCRFLTRLEDHQPAIHMVRKAWESIPMETFGEESDYKYAQATFARNGVFRDFVLNLNHQENIENIVLDKLSKPEIKKIKNHGNILIQLEKNPSLLGTKTGWINNVLYKGGSI